MANKQIKYSVPDTQIEIEVFKSDVSDGFCLIVRDLSIAKPDFDPISFLRDASYNVIHQEWSDAV